jgi:Abnormal spindle-like microcephaly-assoc'd, ASPM-SPD-2-Hydin
MRHRRSHWLSIAVLLPWIALTAGCRILPLPPAAPSVNTPSSTSSSGSLGAAPPPAPSQFTVDPASFSFPSTAIGSTSSINAVATLTSTGNATQLTAITSSNPSEFSLTTTCSLPGALAAGATCLVSIQFKPSSAGARSAQITITTTNGGRVSIAIAGTGVPSTLAQITISPQSLSFPDTVVGSTSFTGAAVFTLTNTGNAAIDLTAITSSNPNEFPTTTTCNLPGSLVPGASCTVSVQFRPGARGGRSTQMTILTSNAGTGTVSVSGAGI